MQYNIDTLMYEARGHDGGAPFITPKVPLKGFKLFKSEHWYRMDSLAVVDKDGKSYRFGPENLPEYDYFELAFNRDKFIKINYRTSNNDNKLQNNEPIFAGVYGVSFCTPSSGKGSAFFEAGFHDFQGRAKDFLLTSYIIPADFELAGFFGRYGARMDKLGIILERNY